MRKITIITTQNSGRTEHQSSATTFGVLKSELSGSINFGGTKVMIRETKTSIESDDSSLPAGDFVLFVMPQKTKAGFDSTLFPRTPEGILSAIGASYNAQAALISKLERELEELKAKLNAPQNEYIPSQLKATPVDFFSDDEPMEDSFEKEDALLAEAREFADGSY